MTDQSADRRANAPSAVRSVALISNNAVSLSIFRGPLIADLIRAGVRVYGLAPDHDEKTRAAMKRLGAEPIDISLDRAGTKPVRDLQDMVRLRRVLRGLKPDLTLSYFAKPVIYGTLAAAAAGVPRRLAMIEGLGTLFSDHLPQPFRARLLRRITARLYKFALRRAEKVIFLNQEDIDQFVSAALVPRTKAMKLGGIGVDLDALRPAPQVQDPPTFLLIARLLREKGVEDYVTAARAVKARHPEARFLLVGGLDHNPGSLRRSEVEDWVAEGLIEWPGQVDDVLPWLKRASVFVLPSYYREGVPRSTQEAMALARPVITTDNVGCRDTVEEGINGFLVPVRNPEALATAMARFITDPALITRMGRESRRIAEERFDVRRINRLIMGVMGIQSEEGQ